MEYGENEEDGRMTENVTDKKELIELVLEEEKKGNIVFMTIEGPMSAKLDDFIKQPAEGLLYDLNRDRVTTLTLIKKDLKWVNDFAVGLVINRLKELLGEK